MSPELARTVFFAIASLMWGVWIVGTLFALKRVRPSPPHAGGLPPELAEAAADVVAGEVVIKGEPEAVSKKIAEQLVSVVGTDSLRITERTAERIAFERAAGVGGGNARLPFDTGLVTLDAEGDLLRVRYAVSMKRFSRIMRIAAYLACFVYGGLIVTAVPVALWTFVVNSDNEAVRWQVFQTFQMVHGVWPPFLIGGLAGAARGKARNFFETLLTNVAHIA